MPEQDQQSGYHELPHAADRALFIWAPDLDELFLQAARGLYDILGAKSEVSKQYYRKISLHDVDKESLLVSFLSELLYLLERDQIIFSDFQFVWEGDSLFIDMIGNKMSGVSTEVKAVTYSGLKIKKENGLFSATVVFDV